VRDPLFQVFVKEMTLRQQSDVTDSATLTPEQFKNQKELALKIIEEIITKGEDKA